MSRYDWMADAACARIDPALWHQDTGGNYATAKRICRSCPVQPQCQAHTARLDADTADSGKHGMWAGQSKSQRETSRVNAERMERHAAILRLSERGGMDAQAIADHVGCAVRTVWRVQKAHRKQMGRAA